MSVKEQQEIAALRQELESMKQAILWLQNRVSVLEARPQPNGVDAPRRGPGRPRKEESIDA